MSKIAALAILIVAVSTVQCQFYYNYEDRDDVSPGTAQEYDPASYQYNSPSAVNQQFLQERRQDTEQPRQNVVRRTERRSRRRQTQGEPEQVLEPQAQPEYTPESGSAVNENANQQERRQSRRRQRLRLRNYEEPTLSPRIFSPSVFERIGLGEAPTGIYIPHDSLLNVLKGPSRRNEAARPVYNPAPAVPQTYVQPSVSYANNQPGERFFVQPPSNDEDTRQRNLILPVSRPQAHYAVQPPAVVPAPVVQTTPRHRRPQVQPVQPSQPVVDIDSYRQHVDEVVREEVPVVPEHRPQVQSRTRSQVQYDPPQGRSVSRNRRKHISRTFIESTLPPRVYSPSVFEKINLGEAPRGVYVPEDSLLNILRNPSTQSRAPSRTVREESAEHYSLQPSETNPPLQANNNLPLAEDRQNSPSRRRSGHRSRQVHARRSEQHEEYQNRYGEEPVQEVQTSSQRQSSRRTEESPKRNQNRAVQTRQTSQTRRRQQEVAARPPQSQSPASSQSSSSSSRQSSSFKPAKLAIAALPTDTDGDGIPGEAGADYPTLHVIPKTSFSCSQQPHNGYYADLETSCQVVHLCQSRGVQDSFLCPNGTIFNQENFSCQWWYKVNCADSPRFYSINDNLYKEPEKKERKRN